MSAEQDTPPGALAVQVGGSHYKDMAIQPVEFIHRNGIGELVIDLFAGGVLLLIVIAAIVVYLAPDIYAFFSTWGNLK